MIRSETRLDLSLRDICHSNIGWFTDRTIDDAHLDIWELKQAEGVYLLWHKNGYCAEHEMFHMKSLYVGKGPINRRIMAHWKKKDLSEEMLVYWSFLELPNRQAKYVEQALLDVYRFPLNIAENTGTDVLCAHFDQAEADFGS